MATADPADNTSRPTTGMGPTRLHPVFPPGPTTRAAWVLDSTTYFDLVLPPCTSNVQSNSIFKITN
jgi:hypothetical protein